MKSEMIRTGVRMPASLKKLLQDIADYSGKTLNGVMLDALWRYVDKAKH